MGMNGPLPKPPDERLRRNKVGGDGLSFERYDLEGEVVPPSGVRFSEKIVQDMWNALLTSVNRKFYEPTDWAYARLTLFILNSVLAKKEIPGAMLLTAIDGMMTKMLMTEGDRRRMKIETKRVSAEPAPETEKASDFYKDQFRKQAAERGMKLVN
jgi:hypothetical protein